MSDLFFCVPLPLFKTDLAWQTHLLQTSVYVAIRGLKRKGNRVARWWGSSVSYISVVMGSSVDCLLKIAGGTCGRLFFPYLQTWTLLPNEVSCSTFKCPWAVLVGSCGNGPSEDGLFLFSHLWQDRPSRQCVRHTPAPHLGSQGPCLGGSIAEKLMGWWVLGSSIQGSAAYYPWDLR